jgi:hypothetical protein
MLRLPSPGRIAALIEQYESEGNPWFSIDTKAKEHLGKLYRKGRIRGSKRFKAFDHDFPSWASLQRHAVRYSRDRCQSHAPRSQLDRIENHGQRPPA